MKRICKVRVLLGDDHETIQARVRSILCEDFEVVHTVHNGRDAITEVGRLDPDVLVIDISMPVLDGLQAASRLHRKGCRTKVVFLTVHEDQDYVDAAIDCWRFRLCHEIADHIRPGARNPGGAYWHMYFSKSIKP